MRRPRRRPLQRAHPSGFRRARRQARRHPELRDRDPDGRRPHARPGPADGALHRERNGHHVVVHGERPLRDRRGRRPWRLHAVEHRRDDPARRARARRRDPTRDEGKPRRRGESLLRRRHPRIPLARDGGGRMRVLLLWWLEPRLANGVPPRDSALRRRERDGPRDGARTDPREGIPGLRGVRRRQHRMVRLWHRDGVQPARPRGRRVPRDMDRIFGTLGVVDDWDAGAWTQVSASNGTEGSGGGAPRVPWAPDFGSGSTPPPLSSTASFSGTAGLNGWYVSPAAVTITVTGGSGTVSIAYRIDGGPWVTYTQPFTLAEGRHVLEYQASDSAGDTEPARTAYVNVDTTAPAVAWDPVAGGTIAPDGSLSWTGSDGGSGIAWYEAGVDGGAFLSVGLQTTLTQQWTEGSHSAIVRAYDAAGNTQSSTIQFNVAGSGSGGGPGGGSGTGTGSPTTSPGFSLRTPPGVPEALIGFALVILGLGLRPRGRSRRPISSR